MSHILNQFLNHKLRHISGGDDQIDGDVLDITYVPSNYTRTTVPGEVTSVVELTAHLAGIDNYLGSVPSSGGALSQGIITTSSASYSVLSTDYTILADATSNAVDVALPAVASSAGRILNVKKIAGSNDVTINPNGAELIDGLATATVSVLLDSLMFQCNGSAWYII
jgi:hypothetical protein